MAEKHPEYPPTPAIEGLDELSRRRIQRGAGSAAISDMEEPAPVTDLRPPVRLSPFGITRNLDFDDIGMTFASTHSQPTTMRPSHDLRFGGNERPIGSSGHVAEVN